MNVSTLINDKDNKLNKSGMKVVGGSWSLCDPALIPLIINYLPFEEYLIFCSDTNALKNQQNFDNT